MMLRIVCAVVVLGGVMSVAWAEPVDLSPAQMDTVTAAGSSAYYADAVAQATATGENAFTGTFSNAVAPNGLLPKLPGFGGGSQAAALAAATGLSASIEASAKAEYWPVGEAIGLATATGPSAFAAVGAGVVNIRGQDYLTGSLAGGADAGVAIVTAPIALSTSSGAWTPPALKPAISPPAVSVTSTEVTGGTRVTYTLDVGDQGGNNAKVSLSFLKPPRSSIPQMLPIDISGVVPVTSTALHATPVAM